MHHRIRTTCVVITVNVGWWEKGLRSIFRSNIKVTHRQVYTYIPQHNPKVHIGKIFKNPKDQKKREEKEVWLSKNIYIYLFHNKGYMITEKARLTNGKEVEAFKPQYFVNSEKIARESGELGKKENGDCVVRAFAAALDLPYDKAHAWVKKELKRKDKKGAFVSSYAKNILGKTKNGKKINYIGAHPTRNFLKYSIGSDKILVNPKYKTKTGYTLKSFIENNPVGRFVLIVQGHAVAVVNGVLYGNRDEQWKGLYRSVWFGFEMK